MPRLNLVLAKTGSNGGLYDFMRRALAGDIGAHLYAKRKAMIASPAVFRGVCRRQAGSAA